MVTLEIRQLTLDDEVAFLAGLKEWEGEDATWHSFAWQEGMSHSDHIRILEEEFKGVNMRAGRVPHTMLYGFLDGIAIGRCSVRHSLNENLRIRGGHIGYAVAPRFRRRGFGSDLFRAGLAHLKGLGVGSAMMTCAVSNLASRKMIEGAGGVLEHEYFDEMEGVALRRYWIDLEEEVASAE